METCCETFHIVNFSFITNFQENLVKYITNGKAMMPAYFGILVNTINSNVVVYCTFLLPSTFQDGLQHVDIHHFPYIIGALCLCCSILCHVPSIVQWERRSAPSTSVKAAGNERCMCEIIVLMCA